MIIDKKIIMIIVETLIIIALSTVLYKSYTKGRTGEVLQSNDNIISKHVETLPIRALDKESVKSQHISVPKDVLKDENKEILATGKVKDHSGTTNITAVLDKPSGDTTLVKTRTFFELMNAQEVGIGYGFYSDTISQQVFYRNTFARIGPFYTGINIDIDRAQDGRVKWSAMAQLSYRW